MNHAIAAYLIFRNIFVLEHPSFRVFYFFGNVFFYDLNRLKSPLFASALFPKYTFVDFFENNPIIWFVGFLFNPLTEKKICQ